MVITNREEAMYWLGCTIGGFLIGLFSSLFILNSAPFIYGLTTSILFLIFGITKINKDK